MDGEKAKELLERVWVEGERDLERGTYRRLFSGSLGCFVSSALVRQFLVGF